MVTTVRILTTVFVVLPVPPPVSGLGLVTTHSSGSQTMLIADANHEETPTYGNDEANSYSEENKDKYKSTVNFVRVISRVSHVVNFFE